MSLKACLRDMRWGGNFKIYTGGIARRHLLGACSQLGPLPATVTLAREEPRQCLEMSRYQSHGYKDSLLADPRVFRVDLISPRFDAGYA